MKTNIIRVSDKITLDDIRNWDNKVITISAGTGAGKSYFIKNILYKFAKANNKKILMLIHRSDCVTQFKQEVERDKKADIIHIKTYQKLEYLKAKYNKVIDFSQYQYIVCDEFHYFMGADAAFNKNTDISLNMILNQTKTTRIFMSATGDYVKDYINNEKGIKTIDYKLEINYRFIRNLTFFVDNSFYESIIKTIIDKKEKAIFFIQSAEQAYTLFKKFKKHCLFNCSKNNEQYYKYVDKNKINEMLINEKFDKSILLTTTCMDAGVNIIDLDVKHIVVSVEDTGSLLQCIGRKRIQNAEDKIELYIKTISNQQLGGKETQLKNKMEMAEYFNTHTVKEYIEKYYKEYDKTHMVYDEVVAEDDKGTKKLNELMYFKCKYDIQEINIMKSYGKFGYCKYFAKLFGFYSYSKENECYNYSLINKENNNSIEEHLEKIKGIPLYYKAQRELIKIANIKRNSKLLKSYKSLNSCFQELNIKFEIKAEYDWNRKINNKKNPHYSKIFWLVEPIK